MARLRGEDGRRERYKTERMEEEGKGRERSFLSHRRGSKINYAIFFHLTCWMEAACFYPSLGVFFREFVIGSALLTSRIKSQG